ncbi:MAG TPA: GAF domain-containing sensor histidine kinase [Aggregatilinea sp.]|uniref:GAF domain-containing sensor histidine kinase n=1 Tax=Aggregatilinea sp. TaxID=2806333 RepID=UPI002C0A06C9|nr:GAF domain-containing sensor histidine kinase [Aggregatilinea sp.]HML24461.1 GAF domain-containing sensor histidine kinase [Aggregatilinea sp.]
MDPRASVYSTHRLDKALFWLRWLFILSAALLLATETRLGGASTHTSQLPLALVVAVASNFVLAVLAHFTALNDTLLGLLTLVIDTALAILFAWVYGDAPLALLAFGTLAILPAAIRLGWVGASVCLVALLAGSIWVLGGPGALDVSDDGVVNAGLSLLLLAAFGILGVALRPNGWGFGRRNRLAEREAEASRLRDARERARAMYEMASTLSSTLDYQRVLDAAQNIGTLGLNGLGGGARIISAALLFQGDDNQLRVMSSRGLTRADQMVAVPGRQGVLGLALKQAEPVFAGEISRDPELHYFVAFQDAKSVLAIPLRAGFQNYGVLLFGSDEPGSFSDEHVELLNAIGTQVTVALQNAVLYQNLLNEKERIVDIEEDTRKKLSRDLHDGPTQSVAAIAMRVNYIRRLIERQPQQAVEELWKVEELARRTTKEIRHMLFTMRPLVLETQGLRAALGQLVEKMRDTYDMNVTLEGQLNVEDSMDGHGQGVLFYIVEEAINNARKHAQAEHVWVRIYRQESLIVVEVEDNGVGFDLSAVDANYDQRGSLGMVNMRERAELIEGTLRITSAPSKGTKITILIPAHGGNASGEFGDEAPLPLTLQSQDTNIRRPGSLNQ